MKFRPFSLLNVSLPVLMLAMPLCASPATDDAGSDVPFKGIARVRTLKSKGKNYKAETSYPVFYSKSKLAGFTSRVVAAEQKKAYLDWLKDSRQALSGETNPVGPYEFESHPSLSFFSPKKLISLRFDSYEFTGGAHGMGGMAADNYGLVAGKPKLLTLGDFFKPGSDYRKLVQTKVLAKLMKDENAEWVHDGSVKTLSNNQFNNFSVEPDGLRWLFNQYEMGPYVVGQFEIKLSTQELGPNFKKEWLTR